MGYFFNLFNLHLVFPEGFYEKFLKNVAFMFGLLLLHHFRPVDDRQVDLLLHLLYNTEFEIIY